MWPAVCFFWCLQKLLNLKRFSHTKNCMGIKIRACEKRTKLGLPKSDWNFFIGSAITESEEHIGKYLISKGILKHND